MSTLVPTYNETRSLRSSKENGNAQDSSSVHAITVVLGLLARFVGLLLLLALLVLASLVWVWLASFRSGWRVGDWLDQQPSNADKLALNVLHGAIVALFSPLAVFGDWSQRLIRERFRIQFPPQIDWQQIVENQLGIKLPEDSPCLPKKTDPSDGPTLPGSSK